MSPLSSGKIKLPALPPSLQPLPPASLHTTVYGIACEAGSTGEGDGEVVRKARKEMSRVRAAASKQSCGGTARDAAFRVTKVELGDTLRVVLAPDVGTEGLDLLRMGRNHSGEWHMTLAYVKDGMSLSAAERGTLLRKVTVGLPDTVIVLVCSLRYPALSTDFSHTHTAPSAAVFQADRPLYRFAPRSSIEIK